MPIPYTREQLDILEHSFAQSDYLSSAELFRLKPLVGLSDVQLRNWFKNKRRTVLRLKKEGCTGSKERTRCESKERISNSSDATVALDFDACSNPDDDSLDWDDLGAILDDVEPVSVIDEHFILTLPRFESAISAPNWRIHGHISHLDSMSASPRMAVWLKEMCNAVSLDAPSIKAFSFDPASRAIILDQVANDTAMQSESWFPKDAVPGGIGMDCRPEGGYITDLMRWDWAQYNEAIQLGDAQSNFLRAKERDRVLLGDGVARDLLPAKFDEQFDLATQRTTRVRSVFSIPVLSMDGSLAGIVQIGTRHGIDEPALNNFMSCLALTLRQPLVQSPLVDEMEM